MRTAFRNLVRSPHNADALDDGRLTVDLPQHRAERRKYRMWKGMAVWHADMLARRLPNRGCVLLTLTYRGWPGTDDYKNAIRSFWDAYRKRFGTRPYFSWVELQQRGVIHYHAIIVDPPGPKDGHTGEAMTKLWHRGRTDVAWRDAGWFRERAAGYAGSYAKKLGEKAYQQDYDQVPPCVRTFQCSRVRTPAARAERTPSWAKMHAGSLGLRITDARKRPRRPGWWLSLVDTQTGELHAESWSVRATLIRGPGPRPPAVLLGPVFLHWHSQRRFVKPWSVARPLLRHSIRSR